MEKESQSKVWVYQSIGFLAIIVLILINDRLNLTPLFLAEFPYIGKSTLEALLVLAVWFLVSTSTRRLMDHVRRLERFMKLCAWCHRVEQHGDWIRLETYLEQGFDTPTSHGICPICLEREKAAAEKARMARSNPGLQGEQPAS